MVKHRFLYIVFLFLSLSAISCSGQIDNRYVKPYKDTKAYELAKAIYNSDIQEIENLVKQDSSLLTFNNPITGSNVLFLTIYLEKYEELKKLLELGGDPNSKTQFSKSSLLMVSIRPFGTQFEWRKELQYAKLLLDFGADPNYYVENSRDERGYLVIASSPLRKASCYNLEAVKLLLNYNADPYQQMKSDLSTPFSKAVECGKIDVINYYIDSLDIDVHQPMSTVVTKPLNETVTYYIQDYIVNKFSKAKLQNDKRKMAELINKNPNIEKANESLWELLKKLQNMGVNFKDYNYR